MSIITLSGWTQPHDALLTIIPNATALDYYFMANEEALFAQMAEHNPHVVVAWSLGGQLAIKAVAARHINPEKLVIIAAPFQFVACDAFPIAMSPETYQQFHANYASNPERTAKRFHGLVAKGDTNYKGIMTLLTHHPQVLDTAKWLPWLTELGSFSATALDYSHFPQTLLVHGSEDTIVSPTHSLEYAKHIPDVVHEIWEGCAHAPHLYDAERLRQTIAHFIEEQ